MSWTIRAWAGRLGFDLGAEFAYERMNHRFQPSPGLLVAEHERTYRRSIEVTLGRQHHGSERLHHLGQARRTPRDHVAGQLVGVDDHRTEVGQEFRDRALAGRDATGESDCFRTPGILARVSLPSLHPGDRVALLVPGSATYAQACLALLDCGVFPVPLDPKLRRTNATRSWRTSIRFTS